MSVPVNPALIPPGPATGTPPVSPAEKARRAGQSTTGPGFAQVLRETSTATRPAAPTAPGVGGTTSAPVNFSGHALQRLERRGISVDANVQQRLGEGVDRAASKGSRTAVVLIDDNAFVVGVPARTVVTAVDRGSMKEHVFTNIDSAVIA
ncbi:MAG: flagellar biosynthesis protein [Solirubrobacteraceae bacterium]|nr:flagellar biosynthesis protein [Solirubrobacteraceae bacterium]